jgi:flagellar hook-length control protein FliK
MLIQASAPNPQAAPILGQQAETADVPLSTFETAVLDPAELLAQLPATEPEGGSRIADVVAATLGDAGASDARASDVPLEPANGESPRAVAGVEQNVVPRSNAESVPRATPPPVSTPLHAPQWSHEFAARVNWLVERGDQMATIRLTPEQLGPVEVRLAIREGEASIWFGAAQAETRAAIEQALPRLRELLAESGLSLADSGVFQQAPRDPRQGFLSSDARRAAMESAASPGELLLQSRHLGLIDDYA